MKKPQKAGYDGNSHSHAQCQNGPALAPGPRPGNPENSRDQVKQQGDEKERPHEQI